MPIKTLFKLHVSTKYGKGHIHITASTKSAARTIATCKGYTILGEPVAVCNVPPELIK